jgi:hypothetical protein
MPDTLISILALIISIIALSFSLNNRRKRKRLRTEFEAYKKDSPETSSSGLEMAYRNSISQSRFRLKLAMEELTELKEQLSEKEFKAKSKIFYSSLEYLFSQYEKACQLYLDGKIDRLKFQEDFEDDLIGLIEKGESSEKYFWSRTDSYQALLKVYREFSGKDESDPQA